jgi:hypothetical protein
MEEEELNKIRKERNRVRQNKWRKSNPEKVKKSKAKCYLINKDDILAYAKKYRGKNNTVLNDKNKAYCDTNKEKRNKRDRNKILNNPLLKISRNLNCLIRSSLRNGGFTKKSKTFDTLGCSFDEFKQHIESQWESWMNWGNYGNPKDGVYEMNKTWDFDHKEPISSAKTEEQIIKLNHYTNYQPLCSYTNRWIKKNKINQISN